jgi:hypothetical protein
MNLPTSDELKQRELIEKMKNAKNAPKDIDFDKLNFINN